MAPLYHLLHHSRCKRIPAGYVRRCMHAALALAAIPRHVTWGLSLGLPDLSSGLIVYVDAAHDFGLACVVLVKIGSTESTTLQLRIPEPYRKSQQRAERWGPLQALGVVVRRRLHPTAICADNMGSILADFRCSAPCANFWLVRLAQRLVRLLVRHFPACALSHLAGKLNPADLGTRCLLSPRPGKWFDTPALSWHCTTRPSTQ